MANKWHSITTRAAFNTAAKMRHMKVEPNGDVYQIVRYVDGLDATCVETLIAVLAGCTAVLDDGGGDPLDGAGGADPTELSSAKPHVDGQEHPSLHTDDKWIVSAIEVEDPGDGSRTVVETLTAPLRDAISTDYTIIRIQEPADSAETTEALVGIQRWTRIRDRDANTLMTATKNTVEGSYMDSTFTDFDLVERRRHTFPDGTSTVDFVFENHQDEDESLADIWTRTIHRSWLEKRGNPAAVDGYNWRKITEEITARMSRSAVRVRNLVAAGDSGSTMRWVTRRGHVYWYGEKVDRDTPPAWSANDDAWEGE